MNQVKTYNYSNQNPTILTLARPTGRFQSKNLEKKSKESYLHLVEWIRTHLEMILGPFEKITFFGPDPLWIASQRGSFSNPTTLNS
jgi:hypothetical protein